MLLALIAVSLPLPQASVDLSSLSARALDPLAPLASDWLLDQTARRAEVYRDEQGQTIEIVDRLREPLMAIAANNRTHPAAFVERVYQF